MYLTFQNSNLTVTSSKCLCKRGGLSRLAGHILDSHDHWLVFVESERNSPVNIWTDLKQIATEFVSAGMHSGEVFLKHTKNPLHHLWGKSVKSAIKVTFSH